MKLEGRSIFTLDDSDVFLCYQNLWKTSQERSNAVYQGIQTEAIKNVEKTLDGNPNQLFASGMRPHQQFSEIKKIFADGKHRTNTHVAKELELADMKLEDYLTTKYGLWLDMRTTDDDSLHGSGRKIEGSSQSIQLQIEKTAEAAGNLDAYVYYIHDAQLNFEKNRLVNTIY